MHVVETSRLILREMSLDDAGFIVELLNDPDFIRYVVDRGVRTREGAVKYIQDGPLKTYSELGFGLYTVVLRQPDGSPGTAIGICGLLKREYLDDVDIGFAFLPAYRRQGYARESALAMIDYARNVLGETRLVAITTPDNRPSIRLLESLGFRFQKQLQPSKESDVLNLYGVNFL